MKLWHDISPNLITIENLFKSFYLFRKGKTKSNDLLLYERNLEDNLFDLYEKLKSKRYKPGPYTGFYINDPKVRLIHKANIEDRVVHHLTGQKLEEIFEPTYIAHSYACRKNKGTHKGVLDLQRFTKKVSRNNTRACFALKCDIKKFFASVNHGILFKEILSKRVKDKEFLNLLKKIIYSFYSDQPGRGLPIGNLTSQHFANIYLNELDQFIKHKLKVKYYLRYTDDFIILSPDKKYLTTLLPAIEKFLKEELFLDLHPKKIKFLNLEISISFLCPGPYTKKNLRLIISICFLK